ncbi:MAG: ATP-binding cassette domain-containing protein [Atopobiaceae bacterium]|nr:ATP-binding cassette domain-containing protein [Atopobiaceae bacterium]
MTRPTLSLSHVTLRYEHGITALDDVTLDVAEGERVCILGPNGSGKSTLASVLCGLLAPDEGCVMLVGELACTSVGVDFDAYRRARRRLGLVFQNPDDQIVTSVVEEDVAFGPENLGVPSEQIGERVARELHRVALDRYAQADPSRLSGGQKQRVAIAGALAMEPQVLVLDEPGALLDVRGRRGIMRVMDKLHDAGTTIIHVTHFMEEALAADRVVILDKGRLVLQGTPQKVFSHSEELVSLGLEEPFVSRLAEALQARDVTVPWTCDEDQLLDSICSVTSEAMPADGQAKRPRDQLMRAREGSYRLAGASSEDAIRADSLSYSYGDTDAREDRRPALDGISFRIPRGSMTAIVGQTGSGKSTLLRLLCALEAPDAGTLVVDGIPSNGRRQRRQLHGHVGYVMQHPERQLFAETVWEDVAYGPTNLGLPAQEIERRCHEALALVGLLGRELSSPFHLSGGQQRLCALAGILAMEPRILVLDEPTAGLDPHGRAQLRAIITDIHARGTTVIQVTHSMDDAAMAEQVIVLNEGRVLLDGSPAEVFSPSTEQTLRESGLGLPDALAWAMRLEDAGVPVGTPLSIDELADAIANLVHEEVEHGL